jgi:DNA-binding transcriptional LysR family regulator
MELRDIEYFAVVAEQRHLGRAAGILGLTQPALSKSLRRLESALGAKLVRRIPTGVDLTAEGSALAARAQSLRLSLGDVVREVRDVTAGRVASLRLGAAPGVPERLLPIPCETLLKDAPKVHIRVTIAHNNLLLPALRGGDLELIVSGIPDRHYEDLVQEHLCNDEFAVFAASRHPLVKRRNPDLSDLVPFRWAAATADVLAWRWLSRAFENRGLPAPRSAFEASSYPLRASITASSDLLCFNSRRGFLESARDQSLVEIPVRELKWTRSVGLSHRRGAYLSPAAQRLIEILRSAAKQDGVR